MMLQEPPPLHTPAAASMLPCRITLVIWALAAWLWPSTECHGADESDLLPLPVWTDQDHSLLEEEPHSIPLGGFLWPEGFNADSLQPPESLLPRTPPDGIMAQGGFSKERPEGFLLFIPKPSPLHPSAATQNGATPPHDLIEVSAGFLRECETLEPGTCLLDPHALLHETQSEDLRRLLAYHAGEARTFAHFLLLDSHEQLPARAELSRIAQGRLVQDHGCLTVYPMAEPWRARIFMTREIAEGVPADYLRGLLQACVQDALQASDPVEQLQRFATQLSIRLIWMERAHPALFTAPAADTLDDLRPATTLAEVIQTPAPPNGSAWAIVPWRNIAIITSAASVSLLAVMLLARALIRAHRRRMRNSVWLLPEAEVKPRFSAPHCGHGGVWIHYGSS